jgi:hypothetical protein
MSREKTIEAPPILLVSAMMLRENRARELQTAVGRFET